MYVSLSKRLRESGTSLILSRSMSGSQGEIISLLVWLNIQHRCFYTVSSLSSDNGCAAFTQQDVIFSCSLGDNKTEISCVKLIAMNFILVLSNIILPCYKPTMGISFKLL